MNIDPRAKKKLLLIGAILAVGIIAIIVYAALTPKLPGTQASEKTVIIDNYSKYTRYISSDSFGNFGNTLYRYIDNPTKSVYHASIVDDSYSYDSDSWFSTFIVKLNDGDVSWSIKLQTLKDGDLNGDIGVTCKTGAKCLAVSDILKSELQDYLPLTTNDYIISYQKNYKKISVIYYDQAGEGKIKAQEKIKSLGFKPEDYEIEYFYGGR